MSAPLLPSPSCAVEATPEHGRQSPMPLASLLIICITSCPSHLPSPHALLLSTNPSVMPPQPESRVPHHMPVHSNYPPTGPAYPSQPPHPMHHHHPQRHASNGPPPPMPVGGPPPPMSVGGPPPSNMGPPPDAGGPPPAPVSNGHHGGTPGPVHQVPRPGREKFDGLMNQLAQANENTWMLIGEWLRKGDARQDVSLTFRSRFGTDERPG